MSYRPNAEQQAAVVAPGDIAVTASAGTGKTAMLAGRYVHHVVVDGLSPLQVVAATFTDKAAAELRQRVRVHLLREALEREELLAELEAAPIGTLHALAARICREHPERAGVAADFTVVTDQEPDLWSAELIEATLADLAPAHLPADGLLPWSVARAALREMLGEPFLARRALERLPESAEAALAEWELLAAELRQAAWAELLDDAWADAACDAVTHHGRPNDKLELVRQQIAERLDEIDLALDEPARLAALGRLAELTVGNVGSPGNWDVDDFQGFRRGLSSLVNRAKAALKDGLIALSVGPADELLHTQLTRLRGFFEAACERLGNQKRRLGVLTYADLELGALRALEHDDVCRWYAERWRAILLDEAQDTNPTQAALLAALRRFEPPRFSLVGDPKQMIYGFRGVREGQFERLAEGVGGRHRLGRTYRQHRGLAEQLNRLFAPIVADFEPVEADREPVGEGPWIELALVDKGELPVGAARRVEAHYVAGWLRERVAEGLAPRDAAVLSRTWETLDAFAEALAAADIPAQHAGGGSLLATREALDGWMLLRALADDTDTLAWAALLRSPFFALPDRELLAISRAADGGAWRESLQGRAADVVAELHAARRRTPPSRLLVRADELCGYSAVIANLPLAERRLADWQGMVALVRGLEAGAEDLTTVLRRLRVLAEQRVELPRPLLAGGDAVTLTTIHGAKGLEWRCVVVPDLARGPRGGNPPVFIDEAVGIGLPGARDGDDPVVTRWLRRQQRERERAELCRLSYVALTRARDRLLLTAADPKPWDGAADGSLLGLLRPGLEACGLRPERIEPTREAALPPAPDAQLRPPPEPETMVVEPCRFGPSEVPISALDAYRECPRRFEFAVVRGHPGCLPGDEAGHARRVGLLVHWALEQGEREPGDLARFDPALPDDQLALARECLTRFNSAPAFEAVRAPDHASEVDCRLQREGLRLSGRIDRLAESFVLDFKTGAEVESERHELQLWAYARATGRSVAHVADLRAGTLTTLDATALERLDAEAEAVLAGIRAGAFEPTPSEAACGRCPYGSVCDAAARPLA